MVIKLKELRGEQFVSLSFYWGCICGWFHSLHRYQNKGVKFTVGWHLWVIEALDFCARSHLILSQEVAWNERLGGRLLKRRALRFHPANF
jgi:hypothetical protein